MAKHKSTKEKSTKQMFLEAFDNTKTDSILDLCQTAGIAPFTFYYHLKKDTQFKRAILEKQQERLAAKIAATV